MCSIEVLVATMNQTDMIKYRLMNIQTDAVFANQAKEFKYQEATIDQHQVKMITTASIGVGKNRNIALQFSTADICLLSDDDMQFTYNYSNILSKAFKEIPIADIIIFNIDTVGNLLRRRKNKKIKRVHCLNFQNYGAARIAFRRDSILRANIWFSLMFGGGSRYSSGEDTLFLREALRCGLKIYTYPETIGTVDQTESTWFEGYNEKFFFDKGALFHAVFPILKYAVGLIYFPWRFKAQTFLSKKEMLKYLLAGMRSFPRGLSYTEWNSSLGEGKIRGN